MKKVKITILKTMLNEDLAKEYGVCGLDGSKLLVWPSSVAMTVYAQ